jgi:hypothetical protein
VDAGAVPSSPDEATAEQVLQVLGGVGDALLALGRDLLDRPLTLGEQVDDLGTPTAGQRLRRADQPVEQCRLRDPVRHGITYSLNRSSESLTSLPARETIQATT